MRELLKSIYPYLFLFFCFVIPLDKYATAIPNIVLISLVLIFPFVVAKSDFKKLLKKEILLFGSLFLYLSLNNLLFQDFTRDVSILLKIGSSLLLIVLYLPIKKTERLPKVIIAAVLICILISLYNIYWFYLEEGKFNFSVGTYIDKVLIIDRLYLGFLCVLSIVASIGLIGNKYHALNKWYFANIVFTIAFVFLISTRFAIVLLLLLFLLKGFYSNSKKEYLFLLLGVIVLVIGAFSINKNLHKRFFYSFTDTSDKNYIELFKTWESRVLVWECNYAIYKNEEYALKGLGFYKTKDILSTCYEETIQDEEKRNYFVAQRFNTHNQFVDFLFSSGLIGLLLFILLFLVMFLNNRKSYFGVSLTILLVFFALIENYFHRQIGAYIFAMIFLLILFPQNQSQTLENKNKNAKN